MWATRSASSLKQGILNELRRLGATYMEAGYGGGNDEGGVESVTVYRPITKENPAYLVYGKPIAGYGENKGKRIRDAWPVRAGSFTTTADAHAGARAKGLKRGEYEVVKMKLADKNAPLYEADTGNWEDEEKLYHLVDELLGLDFGSWAGEFQAYGTVYADLATYRVWRQGEQSTYVSDESAGEY